MLRGHQLHLRRNGASLVRGVDVQLRAGSVLAIAGANGAGKSSLLKMLSGETLPTEGQVEIDARALANVPTAELARRRAVLPQAESLRFSFSVRQVIELGRHPWDGRDGEADGIIDQVLSITGLSALADRRYPSLSGGERARVQLARVLAQLWPLDSKPPRYLLLDEPTASLDLAAQADTLSMLRSIADQGVAIAVVLHDLNQILQVADEVLLMKDGAVLAQGPTDAVLQPEPISRAFGIEIERVGDPGRAQVWIAPKLEQRSWPPM